METECRKWNAISVGECTSMSVEWKGVQSHVGSEGWNVTEVCQNFRDLCWKDRDQSQNECPLTIFCTILYIYYCIWKTSNSTFKKINRMQEAEGPETPI